MAAKNATTTIPIVLALGADPVNLGLVPSLNRPGGNVTGVTFLYTHSGQNGLICYTTDPRRYCCRLLHQPPEPHFDTADQRRASSSALTRAVELRVLNASSEREIDAAFGSAVQQHVNAVVVGADSVFLSRRDQLVGLAARYALPAIYYVREFAVAGGLISYGASITDAYRLAGRYAGRILKGEKPADLPVQAADQIRTGDQSQDRKGPRAHGAAVAACSRRRGDRISADDVRFWHKADIPSCTAHVRFWG